MIGIYKITNLINNKSYIGQSIDIKRRWSEHRARRGTNPIYKDMEEFGLDNFSFEILEECQQDKLDEREIYWIQKYDTYYNGYNRTLGGQFYANNKRSINNIILYKGKIPSKAWAVYYYLISNSIKIEDEFNFHIYKSDFKISEASKILKISRTTFYSSLKKLQEEKLINFNEDDDIYYIPKYYNLNSLTKEQLKWFLGYTQILGIDFLRTYLFIKVFYENKTSEQCFTRRNLVRCLGHADTDDNAYQKVDIYLNLLEKWKLIYLNVKTEVSDLGKCYLYYVLKVNDNSQYLQNQTTSRFAEKGNPYGLSAAEEKEIQNIM